MTDRSTRATARDGEGRTKRLTADDASEAGALIAAGRLVAFPTETVYGLGADATDPRAVAALYAAKGRPAFNPLIAHVSSLDDARRLARLDGAAEALARAFWPGPLTIVAPVSETCAVCELARAGLPTIALRAPDHPIAQELIAAAGRPVVAPSANRSGRVSPTTAGHVLADLDGLIDAVVEGGATRVGLESTIVGFLDETPRLLRPGALARADIEAALGRKLAAALDDAEGPAAPGRLASHYAPAARLRLDATDIRDGEAFLGFGPDPEGVASAAVFESLSASGDLVEAASNLFAALRRLDAAGAGVIAVAPIPAEGIGEAIRDRLARAAAPRG